MYLQFTRVLLLLVRPTIVTISRIFRKNDTTHNYHWFVQYFRFWPLFHSCCFRDFPYFCVFWRVRSFCSFFRVVSMVDVATHSSSHLHTARAHWIYPIHKIRACDSILCWFFCSTLRLTMADTHKPRDGNAKTSMGTIKCKSENAFRMEAVCACFTALLIQFMIRPFVECRTGGECTSELDAF